MKTFSISQIILALAITYLAYSLSEVARQVPDVVAMVNNVKPQMDNIALQVALVKDEVTLTRELITKQLPEVLRQVEASIATIDNVIAESENYSRNIPSLLQRLEYFEQQIPLAYQRLDNLEAATNHAVAEIALWRPHSNHYIEELALARENIPQYLTRIERIIEQANQVGEKNSSGFVSGIFKGVISLPFEVVSGLTNIVDSNSQSAKHLTAKDVATLQEHLISLLDSPDQKHILWSNIDSGNYGRITKQEEKNYKGKVCVQVEFTNFFNKQKETLEELMCPNKEGLWQVM
ncbi:hypothetical protein [Litorilituus lipolyticus]|uniref:Surface antigen domain-containing protein n=1 Tax=Litorilituus lipolyticus TaxID=2491017 RepID=A0A502KLC9_9GAMM|nr:hypothetical protein [Litorilituus lipolyticus]TPH12024.1 hypothetical protein EPA86_16805 [Litorilituus lipolyticus]